MKIKRHQVGGIMYQSPFGPSAQATASSATSASNGPEKISGTIKKEIIDILKESGIQSDVDAFLNKANSFLNNSMFSLCVSTLILLVLIPDISTLFFAN